MDTSNFSSSSSSSLLRFGRCFDAGRNMFILSVLLIAHILLLPVFMSVVFVGFQQWQKRRSVSTAMTSHSDVLTFNIVALELISVFGFCILSFGSYTKESVVTRVGFSIFSIILPGQSLFHLLACMERYLAVVHPITYLGLRQAAAIRIRNITIGCVWMICFLSQGLTNFFIVNFDRILRITFMVITAVVVSFCSVSVVCVLIRPGPGNKERVDPVKQKAFYTIVILTGSLLLKFLSNFVCTALLASSIFPYIDNCLVWASSVCFGLPGSLILPLLFLRKLRDDR